MTYTYIVLIRMFYSKKYVKQFLLWIFLLIGLLLIAGPSALHISYSTSAMKTRHAAAHVFSEERARDYLINLTQYGSRISQSRGSFEARKFLISQIQRIRSKSKRRLRFEIDLQNFTDVDRSQLQNIIVRVSNPSTKSGNVSSLLLSAHYDSGKCVHVLNELKRVEVHFSIVEFSPGGSDDGSGVVILLELLSNVINDLTITLSDVHLIVLLTDGEEMDLRGSKAFTTKHMWRHHIHRFINVDSVSCHQVASLIQITSSQVLFTL